MNLLKKIQVLVFFLTIIIGGFSAAQKNDQFTGILIISGKKYVPSYSNSPKIEHFMFSVSNQFAQKL